MMGYKSKNLNVYTLVLLNNSPVKVVFTDEKESQKGVFVQMLNKDSFIFKPKIGDIDTIAMTAIKYIRTDYKLNKVLGGVSTLIGGGLLYMGSAYLKLDPKVYGKYIKVLGAASIAGGIGYIAYVPYFVLHPKFRPQSKYFGVKKISCVSLKNKRRVLGAMNKNSRGK